MDKTPLYFLIVAALLGGILCDNYMGLSFPFFTLVFVSLSAIIFAVTTKPFGKDEEE